MGNVSESKNIDPDKIKNGGGIVKNYKIIEVTEKQLEEMIRKIPHFIEEGLKYLDHQKRTPRGPFDVLFVDSGKSLAVAELKAIEDDGILIQGIDYYDYISNNIEGFARAYKDSSVDPMQKLRLFLIAPSFSVSLLNRCKWVDISVSLFTFQCIVFEDNPEEIIPIFKEITIPLRQQIIEVYTIGQRLDYITDSIAKKRAEDILKEIKEWNKENILIEPIKNAISIKAYGTVFTYLEPRRKHFVISTYDTMESGSMWESYPVRTDEDLNKIKALLKENLEYYK